MIQRSLTPLAELLHRALKAQMHYAQDHPRAVQSVEAVHQLLQELLRKRSPIILTSSGAQLWYQGRAVEGAPNATQALAKEMDIRSIGGIAFYDGLDQDELQLLFFALQLRPQRLREMGGARSLLPEGANLRILEAEPPESIAIPPAPEEEAGAPDFSMDPITDPFLVVEAPEVPAPRIPEPPEEAPLPEPPSPAALAVDLRTLFSAIIQMTGMPPRPSASSPWSSEQRETLADSGFLVPDFSSVAGTGEQLGLGRMDPVTLRNALRSALAELEPMSQGAVLLGLPSFPAEEQALRRALDYLAPELLAQSVAEVHLRRRPSRFELALLVAGLLQCVKDRELSLEAIRGRLQFEGWDIQDLDALKDAILWECHGTDTKLQMSLMDRGVFELDAHQVMILNRQLIHGKRMDGLKDLLNQLETGFASPQVPRRRHTAEIVADLAECLQAPGLPQELEARLLSSLHGHIDAENDPQALLWSCQAMEALLGHWIRKQQFEAVYKEMLALAEFALAKVDTPPWKAQAVRDMLARLASPSNMATLADLLQRRDPLVPIHQLHALLSLMGRPAAEYLVTCLETDSDKTHRQQLLGGIRAIGRNAVPALRDALASPQWFMVRNAVTLLGEINFRAAFEDVVLALGHRDPRVRRAAIHASVRLGDPEESASAIADLLLRTEPDTQLDCLAALGEVKSPAAVQSIVSLLQNTRSGTEESARIRLRAVEVLGLIASPMAIDPLQELFRKKGFLGGRESTAMRLAAARSLAAINTRESREAIALALDQESHEEVRAVLRGYLVGNS
ncbi:MAG TPA: HEAT repeat domain-containing protein [Holophaga sp.]|nr:HEAT repeat domain-containing protein [Holophaga sp.]HPS67923.1 HEAT repeat domain-containing protein [Holophaga sp.]